MIDIHTHILFNIDDGSDNIEESVKIIKTYYKKGIKHIVLTPHYIENSEYKTPYNLKLKKINELRRRLEEESIDVKLYVGNEVYLSKNILKLLDDKEISTINNSRYLLLELPFVNENQDTLSILHDLVLTGIIPIIAHPERYSYIQKDISKLDAYKKIGALIQVNKDSLFNKYGRKSKKTVKKIIKERKADFIATDVHHITSKMSSSRKIRNRIIALADKKYAKKIMFLNPAKVIKNQMIYIRN